MIIKEQTTIDRGSTITCSVWSPRHIGRGSKRWASFLKWKRLCVYAKYGVKHRGISLVIE